MGLENDFFKRCVALRRLWMCSLLIKNIRTILKIVCLLTSADPEGGTGGPDPPPGKSQVIWVHIGNKQLDPPPPPWKKLDDPWKMLDPLWNLEK